MTRLSDSLRGLADRAPVGDVVVSTSTATRRIYRARRLRAAANATAGVGVAAVVALAAIHPGTGAADSSPDAAVALGAPETPKAGAPGFGASDATRFAWGQCGTRPFDVDMADTSAGFSMTLDEVGADVDSGGTVDATLTVTAPTGTDASAFISTGPSYMVLWDGVVVAITQDPSLDPTFTPEAQPPADATGTKSSPVDLVNCWDGTPLPAGAYELVAYQDFYPATGEVVPPTEPTLTPVEPTLVPVDPSAAPDSPIAVDGTVGTGTGSDSGATPGNTGVVGPAVDVAARAVSNTVTFVVAGEVPADPFGAYLNPAVPAVVYPDDYLTPAAARDEYATRATTGTWDMAAGTQRVVRSSDSTEADDPNAWLDSYYGCSADGTTTPSFPATSAEWPLLSVDATLPRSVGVSYGWVVDGNPEVKVSVTNVSGHTLPGFWGQPNTSMYLVKDGKVIATSYLAPTDPNGYSKTQSTDGLLGPDGTLSGTYLWRDVTGCWIGDAQAKVPPGTYTVLTEQDIYLDNGGGGPVMTYADGKTSVGAPVPGAGTTSGGASSLIAPAPAPFDGTYDWLSLQVWTSLGQVTVR